MTVHSAVSAEAMFPGTVFALPSLLSSIAAPRPVVSIPLSVCTEGQATAAGGLLSAPQWLPGGAPSGGARPPAASFPRRSGAEKRGKRPGRGQSGEHRPIIQNAGFCTPQGLVSGRAALMPHGHLYNNPAFCTRRACNWPCRRRRTDARATTQRRRRRMWGRRVNDERRRAGRAARLCGQRRRQPLVERKRPCRSLSRAPARAVRPLSLLVTLAAGCPLLCGWPLVRAPSRTSGDGGHARSASAECCDRLLIWGQSAGRFAVREWRCIVFPSPRSSCRGTLKKEHGKGGETTTPP